MELTGLLARYERSSFNCVPNTFGVRPCAGASSLYLRRWVQRPHPMLQVHNCRPKASSAALHDLFAMHSAPSAIVPALATITASLRVAPPELLPPVPQPLSGQPRPRTA